MRNKPIWEYTDGRMSVQYALQMKELLKARIKASKLMGTDYFKNNKEIIDEPRTTN